MARRKRSENKRPIESYEHKDKKRVNNPPVGLVTPQTDPEAGTKKTYQYDPHLPPELQWAGKAEHTSFEVPTVSLHVHERIDPLTIIEAVRKIKEDRQLSFFDQMDENPPPSRGHRVLSARSRLVQPSDSRGLTLGNELALGKGGHGG